LLTWLAAARELVARLAGDPTGGGDPDLLLLGDWNAYPREDASGAALALLARRLRADTRESQRTLTL
jgi:predicted extracellular nuclease